ncbi:MAG: hypothetical protein NVS3B1_06200 [Marmoricola sp.]
MTILGPDPVGATVAIRCAKGCGTDVLVSVAQMELMRGIPGVPRFQHETCPGEADVDETRPMREFHIELIVTETLADETEDTCARFKVGVEAKTFVEAVEAISPELSKLWAKVAENAPLVDMPRETPTDEAQPGLAAGEPATGSDEPAGD